MLDPDGLIVLRTALEAIGYDAWESARAVAPDTSASVRELVAAALA